jgi:hypothetical protein
MAGATPGVDVSVATWAATVPGGDPELGFYVWWMQNVPGLNNAAGSVNWWALIADLDQFFPYRNRF